MITGSNSQTYRATVEAWLGRFLLPFLFLGLLVVTLVNQAQLNPWLAGLGLLGLLVVGVFDYAMPMLLNWLKLDPSGVVGNINGRRFHIYWSEVLAAWIIRRGRQPFLCLGTSKGTAMIPLRFLDTQQVWDGIREYVSPSALESSAFQRLPDYREWAAVRESLVSAEQAPRQVIDHWFVQMAGWGSLGFYIADSFNAWQSGSPEIILLYLPLSAISVIMIANWGITEMDKEGVRRRTMAGSWYFRWDELERVEMAPFDSLLVLEGAEKRLVISGPLFWINTGRRETLTLLKAQCEHRQVPIRRTLKSLFKFSRNSRVKTS